MLDGAASSLKDDVPGADASRLGRGVGGHFLDLNLAHRDVVGNHEQEGEGDQGEEGVHQRAGRQDDGPGARTL